MTNRGYVTRRETFSAAHRLHSAGLSAEENLNIYGRCNSVNGHGHNYGLQVTVEGPISPQTGMVADLKLLKNLIWRHALDQLDHSNLDKDHEWFRGRPSTAENLSVHVWELLAAPIAELGMRLHSVRIQETEHNSAEYRGVID